MSATFLDSTSYRKVLGGKSEPGNTISLAFHGFIYQVCFYQNGNEKVRVVQTDECQEPSGCLHCPEGPVCLLNCPSDQGKTTLTDFAC
jgi:hypothetical protein